MMRCDFCGEAIESQPFYKEGMCFCSNECADAMEGGEAIPLGAEILDDSDTDDDEEFEVVEPSEEEEEEEDAEKIYQDYEVDDEFFEEE